MEAARKRTGAYDDRFERELKIKNQYGEAHDKSD